MDYIYYFAAMLLVVRELKSKKEAQNTLGKFLLYLEQYLTEVDENKRLKSVEVLNKNLQDANTSLIGQMRIVGGLSNAYFSVYSVDLKNGRCEAVKVIESFKKLVKSCHVTA